MDDFSYQKRIDTLLIEKLILQPASNWTPEQTRQICGWVHEMFTKRLHHTAYLVLHNYDDAEDVVTDLYAEFAKEVRGFDPKRAKLETFLNRIVQYKAVDYLRSHRRERAAVSLDAPRGTDSAKDDWSWDLPDRSPAGGDASRAALPEDRAELLAWLAGPLSDALHTLRGKNALHADALWHSISGMKSADIANAIGCNDGTARQYVSRGKKFLREYLRRRGFDWSISALDTYFTGSGAVA